MCYRVRSIHEWSQIPRQLYSGPRVNFEFNPNVAPTEIVPALIAGDGVVLARFGIKKIGAGGKPREYAGRTASNYQVRTGMKVLSYLAHARSESARPLFAPLA